MTFKPGDKVRLRPPYDHTRRYQMRVVGIAESGWVVCEYGDEAFDSFAPDALVHDLSSARARAEAVVIDYFWDGHVPEWLGDFVDWPGPARLADAITRAIEEAVDEARQEAV